MIVVLSLILNSLLNIEQESYSSVVMTSDGDDDVKLSLNSILPEALYGLWKKLEIEDIEDIRSPS